MAPQFPSRPQRPLIRLDRNEALLPPPSGAVRRIQAAALRVGTYPDDASQEVVGAIARFVGVDGDSVLVTSGVDEASDLCLLELNDLWTITPGFNGYADRARAIGKSVHLVELEDDLRLPKRCWEGVGVNDVVMLASPNNPTGQTFDESVLLSLLERDVHVLLDETYVDFADGGPGLSWLARFPRLLVFRSFSKAFALAGLRLGVLFGEPNLLARLRSRQPFQSVDRLALEGVLGALEENPLYPLELAKCVAQIREWVVKQLRETDRFERVYESATNFVLAVCPGEHEAEVIRAELRDAGVLVASGASFGVPRGIRITIGPQSQMERLLTVLRRD